ncbi:type II toxin-antitoxin system HicA family toxin [Rhizobium sp. B230/85]|nr:type II toxin-antitoxin system HicA family toxin [Rhizobium sp. B209b/85]QXZ80541.1 type II toxin-antitoxin system HicA family toxin [Rhizobium sp. L51/94]QXZ98510.1 type II toxin-antitoxin system HicA family toxin [Rhizobium sp. B230/85]
MFLYPQPLTPICGRSTTPWQAATLHFVRDAANHALFAEWLSPYRKFQATLCNLDLYTFRVCILSPKSVDINSALTIDVWFKAAKKGSHVQFKHPSKLRRVTVPHPKQDIPLTLKSIEKQSGLKLR